jgi:hypothetical protein
MRVGGRPGGLPVYRLLTPLSAFALLVSLSHAAPVPKDAGKNSVYFPTQKGTKWTYTHHHNQKETFVVTEVVEKNGEKFISVGREVKEEVVPAGKFKLTKEGRIEPVGIRRERDVPLPTIDRPVKPGDEWEEDAEFSGVPVKWKVAIRGSEKVKVPAGTFEAVRIEHTYTFKGIGGQPGTTLRLTEWYAPGVGRIRDVSDGKEQGALTSFTPGKD